MSIFACRTAATVSAFLASAGIAAAAQSIRFHFVSHNVGLITMDVADGVEGHIIGAAKFTGIVTLEDGTNGTVTYLSDIDYVKGSGTYSHYDTFKFDDGSVLRFKASGTAKPSGTKTEFPDGTFKVLGGEGRFKGASGGGEYKGTRIAPIADGGDTIEDGVIHLD